jgi:hypothetical protein
LAEASYRLGWRLAGAGDRDLACSSGRSSSSAPTSQKGWAPAGAIVPIALIAWSIWLILIGVFLLFG